MIFDDDNSILDVCKVLLESRGYAVHTRSHCKNLLSDIDNFKPHLILMEHWIRDNGGVVATQTVKNNDAYRNISVLFFSSILDVEEMAKIASADAFIDKPFDIYEFCDLVEKTINAAPKEEQNFAK